MSGFILRASEFANNFDRFVVLDCRADLSDPRWGRSQYLQEHIKGSFFVDEKSVLTGKIEKHGGRHPFPDMKKFVTDMENFGISDSSKVACFGEFGARAAFMLRLLGIKASIVSGNSKTLKKAGISFDSVVPASKKGKIPSAIDESFLCSVDEVRKNMNNPKFILIDCRSPERYRGEVEPQDSIAGHIPGAVNFFWQNIIKEDGCFLSDNELRDHFQIDTNKRIALYCGSGVTACFNWLALKQTGIDCSIYVGSWSDWISYPANLELIEPKIS